MRKKQIFLILFIVVAVVLVKLGPIIGKFSPVLFQLFFNKEITLKKNDDTINVLLLGIGGGSHEGPDLTDTIIFASIDEKNNKTTLVSIPRDFWVTDLGQKINTAYTIGEVKKKGGGLILAKAIVAKIVDKPIDYAIRIDFDGFVKAVDYVGGLDITVEHSFDDYQYPVEEKREDLCDHSLDEATVLIATEEATVVFPCRYEHVHFDQGMQHMDGKTTLIFVRSRYAEGEEGTDFARSMRQQNVIKTFRDKILSAQTFLNPIKLANLYSALSESIDTDVQTTEIDDFIKLGQKMKKATINSFVIDYGDEEKTRSGLLTNPPLTKYDGSWVLIPRKGENNYSEIQAYVQCVLTKDVCPIK